MIIKVYIKIHCEQLLSSYLLSWKQKNHLRRIDDRAIWLHLLTLFLNRGGIVRLDAERLQIPIFRLVTPGSLSQLILQDPEVSIFDKTCQVDIFCHLVSGESPTPRPVPNI